jgi:hypothetical protein
VVSHYYALKSFDFFRQGAPWEHDKPQFGPTAAAGKVILLGLVLGSKAELDEVRPLKQKLIPLFVGSLVRGHFAEEVDGV